MYIDACMQNHSQLHIRTTQELVSYKHLLSIIWGTKAMAVMEQRDSMLPDAHTVFLQNNVWCCSTK